MSKLSKRTSWSVGAILLLGVFTAVAKASLAVDIYTSVLSKAAQSKQGVVLVLTKRGDVAAQAAYLLLAQIKQNRGFAPLFMAVDDVQLPAYMVALGLPSESLPAVIFYNKSGAELARVVAASSAMTQVDKPPHHAD